MACELKSSCDFLFGFLKCALPEDTIDVKLTVRTVKGIHTFGKDHTTEYATCSPWSRWMKPFPSFRKKIETFKEEKKMKIASSHHVQSNLLERLSLKKIQRQIPQEK